MSLQFISIIVSIVIGIGTIAAVFIKIGEFKNAQSNQQDSINKHTKEIDSIFEWRRQHENGHGTDALKSEERWGKIEQDLAVLVERSEKWKM